MLRKFQKIPKAVLFTGVSGLVLFYLLGALALMGDVAAMALLKIYTSLILSFLCGVQWAFLARLDYYGWVAQICVIAPVALFLGAFYVPSTLLFFCLSIALYIAVYGADYFYFAKVVDMPWYLALRSLLTGGVLILLMSVTVALV